MIRQLLILLFITISSNTILYSQQSGYMGKTIAVEYDLGISPSLSTGFIGNTGAFIGIKHNFYLEKSITEDISLAFGYKAHDVYVPARTADLDFSLNKVDIINYYKFKNDFLISFQTFTLAYMIYTGKANIAPFGSYFRFEFGPSFYSLSKKNSILTLYADSTANNGNKITIYRDFKDENTYVNFNFSLNYGLKRIIYKDFYFIANIGVNMNAIMLLGLLVSVTPNDFIPNDLIKRTGRRYYQWQNLTEVKIGIGYFLF